MGVEDTAKRGFFSAKPSLKNRSTIFTLGNRGTVLTSDLEGPIIVPHAAQKGEQKVGFISRCFITRTQLLFCHSSLCICRLQNILSSIFAFISFKVFNG